MFAVCSCSFELLEGGFLFGRGEPRGDSRAVQVGFFFVQFWRLVSGSARRGESACCQSILKNGGSWEYMETWEIKESWNWHAGVADW